MSLLILIRCSETMDIRMALLIRIGKDLPPARFITP